VLNVWNYQLHSCAVLNIHGFVLFRIFFHITGSYVKLVSDFAGKIPFSDMLQDRRKRFLDGLRFVDNSVLQFMSVLV